MRTLMYCAAPGWVGSVLGFTAACFLSTRRASAAAVSRATRSTSSSSGFSRFCIQEAGQQRLAWQESARQGRHQCIKAALHARSCKQPSRRLGALASHRKA